MEIWDLYNKNREIIGSQIRGEPIPDNAYHLVAHIWIKNKKGEFLISRRSETRPTHPLLWECPGGSVLKGENSLSGALRETKEEVGIELKPDSGKLIFSKTKGNWILDVWLFNYDGDIDLKKATTDEVCDIKWMTKEEIKKCFDEKQFVPKLKYFFDIF